jgi:hypothetical protein
MWLKNSLHLCPVLTAGKPGEQPLNRRRQAMKKCIFTSHELEQMGARTTDLIDESIDSGNLEKAKTMNRRMHEEASGNQDFFVNWASALLTFIYRKCGDEMLYEALQESFGAALGPAVMGLTQMTDARKKAEMLASMLRVHLSPLKIEEDDEKITFMMKPCGTGGRLVLKNKYAPPLNLARIKDSQHMTFGRKDFPIYCTHCAMGEIIALEAAGAPLFAFEPAHEIGKDLCRFHVYKDLKNIPARFYERYGKKKPG